MDNEYEAIIVGGGPAGLSAGLYTSRARLSSLLIEKGLMGGQITEAELVENYPGFEEGISGFDLGQLMHKQAVKYGLNTVISEVTAIELKGEKKIVNTGKGNFSAKALIIASGSKRRRLNVPGEDIFAGRGVSYCATCDATFFTDLPVAVVGGGNAAITEAIHLSRFASSVVVIHRRDQLRATRVLQEKALADPKIEMLWDSVVKEIEGDDKVRQLKLRQVKTGKESVLKVSGVFVSVGLIPSTDFLKGLLPLDDDGYIITNENMETKIAGIYAAGDIRRNSIRQAITAAGDGATAAIYAEKFVSE